MNANTSPSPKQRGKILEDTLEVKQSVSKAKNNLFWGTFNGSIVAALTYDVLQRHQLSQYSNNLTLQLELLLTAIALLNSVFHFVKYIIRTFYLTPVSLSPGQKQLLGVQPSDPNFKSTCTPTASFPSPSKTDMKKIESDFTSTTPMNLSAVSWLSPVVLNDSASSSSPNYSMSSPSWVYQRGTASPVVPMSPTSQGAICDEQSLTQYLHDFEEQEKKASVSLSVEQPSHLLSSFWNTTSKTGTEVSPMLRRCNYQLAPLTTALVTTSPGAPADETSPSAVPHSQDIWRQLKVDPVLLTQWNANLRMWISQTILQRLVKEFDSIDDSFQRFGLSDMHLGSVGLERLKKTAVIPQVALGIPSLPRLVPFLELSPHQEYLVARIRDLAKGGSMSEFRWNSGGSLNGKNWEEHLPTDAAIVMHLIGAYLDSQLLPLPHHPDGRPFTSQHYVRSPERPPKGGNTLLIYQAQLNPPHFVLVENEDSLEVAKGRNNLLQTFLLFLYLLKTKEHGMLGRINLGPSGVNILWVIDA